MPLGVTHVDVTTTGGLTTDQTTKLKEALQELSKDSDFAGASFYLNTDYIGGRPNDR